MGTIDYYNENAERYFNNTVNAYMNQQYNMFLKYMKEEGKILDFGCGSGRDSLFFKNLGYDVDAIDGSEELCKLAREYTGLDVKCMDFKDFNSKDVYDGVWACATLLHVKRDLLLDTLIRIRESLKNNGVIYTSFKKGEDKEEYLNDGRYFNFLSKKSFDNLYDDAGLRIIDFNVNKSLVKTHNDVYWNSFVLKKK